MSGTNSVFDELMDFSATEESAKRAKMKPSEKLLADIEGYGFEMKQLGGVLKTKGNQLIVSCAGSGKTTSIIFKIIYDLKSGRSTVVRQVGDSAVRCPDSIWVATFLKSGADELRNSYRRWCNRLHCADMSQVIRFSTLHAEFKRVISEMGITTDIIPDADNKKLLRSVLSNYGIKSSKGGRLSEEELGNLVGALTRTRNRLDLKRYDNEVYTDLGITDTVVDCILRDWKNARQAKDLYDFEDLQEVLYDACYVKKDEKVINYLSGRYKYIYLDEFQDTSQIQYAVLKIYCSGSKQVVAIGDDDQTIYSWRGSDNSIITSKFVEDFSPVKNDLSVNFRCPKKILDSIKTSISLNSNRFYKELESYNDGGEVRVGSFAGYRQMAMALGDMVYDDVSKGMSVAILCRTNSDGLLPALFFDKMDKFRFSISGKNMTLDSYIGRLAISIVKLFTDRYSQDVKRALDLLTFDSYGISQLIGIFKANNESIWTISEEDLRYSCYEIAERVMSWRDFRKVSGDIATLKLVLQEYRYGVFVKDNQFNDVMRSVLISIESLLDYYDYEDVDDFLMELQDINSRLKGREKKAKCEVKIATVHEFKGKEADSVYIWNDSDGVYPYKRSEGDKDDYEEERRIHYIAGTRARKVSTIMYLSGKKGAFVEEMDLSGATLIEKETSGVLKRSIEEKLEENKGISEFEKAVSVDTGEIDTFGNLVV